MVMENVQFRGLELFKENCMYLVSLDFNQEIADAIFRWIALFEPINDIYVIASRPAIILNMHILSIERPDWSNKLHCDVMTWTSAIKTTSYYVQKRSRTLTVSRRA